MFKKIISTMLAMSLIMGCNASAFAYTRGDFAADLADVLGLSGQEWTGNQWFTDVRPGNAQYGPINWLKYEDIMTGHADRSFGANDELRYNDVYNALRNLDAVLGTDTLTGLLDADKPVNEAAVKDLLNDVRRELGLDYPDAGWRYDRYGGLKSGDTKPGYILDVPSNKAHAVITLTNAEWYTVYFGTNANYKQNGAGLHNPASFYVGVNGTYYLTFLDVFGNADTAEIVVKDVLPEPEVFKSRPYGAALSEYYKRISQKP